MSRQQPPAAPPPAAGGQGQGQGADPEGGRVRSLDARFGAIEAEQKQQAGILEKIAAAVGAGGGAPAPAPAGGAPAAGQPADTQSIADQVRREIADADQRRKAEEDDKTWRAGVSEVVEQVRAEKAPRPPQTGPLAVARRIVLGKGWDA